MPRVVRPTPPVPVTVSDAVRLFGSEVLVALTRHYLLHPGTQKEAMEALRLPQQLVSTSTRTLIEVGVLLELGTNDGRVRTYRIDQARLTSLTTALVSYVDGSPQE